MPILELPKLSQSQQEIYDEIMSLEKFTLAKLNQKTNKPILKLKDHLDFFQKIKITQKEHDHYTLTQSALLMKHPENFRFLDKIQLRQINYKTKLRPKITESEIRNKLSFLKVTDMRNCYMVYYKME